MREHVGAIVECTIGGLDGRRQPDPQEQHLKLAPAQHQTHGQNGLDLDNFALEFGMRDGSNPNEDFFCSSLVVANGLLEVS